MIQLENVHSSSVELDGKAVLIKGKSGSGKSELALKLIVLGAKLISDDQTTVFIYNNHVYLRAPKSLPSGIEIRGVGIVNVPKIKKAQLRLVVDLSQVEKKRFPSPENSMINILGYSFPFYFFRGIKEPANAIYALLKYGTIKL